MVTIQNILPPIFLSNPVSLIPSLLFMEMGMATIMLDLRNWQRERRQGLQHVWYQRIMTLTGVLLILTGLMIFIFTNIVTFGNPLYFTLSLVFQFVVVALGIYAFLIIIRSTIKLSIPPQAIYVGRIDAEQAPLAANPLLLRAQIILIGGTFLLLGVMLLAIVQLFSLVTEHYLFFWEWALLIVMPFLAFWLLGMSRRLRALQRIERLRFSFPTERSIDIAFPPGSSAFFTPLSITLRIKRTYIGILAVFIAGFLLPGTINLFVQQGFSLIFWIALGFTPLVLGFIPLFIIRTTVETRENGLRTEAGKFIHWHEARLFTCYTLPGLIPGDRTTIIYELSSSSTVITWRWLQRPQSPLTLWKPLLPPGVYHQQMQTLCELVIEKTGLRLYDMDQLIEEKGEAR